MMKVLIVGDSLAGGLPHLSYPAVLAKMLPRYEIIARGLGGDTLAGISKRLELLLPKFNPDVAVIEAGSNDVMLPFMEAKGGKWKWLAERIERRGSVPASDAESFRELYSTTIEKTKRKVSQVVVTTISCLGEDLQNKFNKIKRHYDSVIREVADEHGVRLADTAKAFEEILAGEENPSSFFLSRFRGVFLDTFHALTPRGAEKLSARRGLILTIDGAHLNPKGAGVYAEVIREALMHDLVARK